MQIAHNIIASHLVRSATSASEVDTGAVSTFIIATPNTSIVSSVHAQLQHSLVADTSRSELSVKLLDTVQLLQYFDFAGLAESVSEVSDHLHGLLANREKHSTSNAEYSKRLILFVDGLDSALESTQHRSGFVQANALGASLLRSITHLSRNYPSLLVLLSLEANQDTRSGDDFTSAFSSSTARSIREVGPGGMLRRTLLAGIDTVVLVHDSVDSGLNDGDLIVEVVKDRAGASLGHWAVWPSSG